MVRLVRRILKFNEVPERYKIRLNTRWDSVKNRPYLDMRMLVSARLLALSRKKNVKQWLKSWVAKMKKEKISTFDKRPYFPLFPINSSHPLPLKRHEARFGAGVSKVVKAEKASSEAG